MATCNSLALSNFFLRRRFISTKQIYKKNHTYNTKHTIYKKKEKRAKKRLEVLKEGTKRKWGGSHMSFKQSRDIIRSSCSAYILFMQSTRSITYNQNFGI